MPVYPLYKGTNYGLDGPSFSDYSIGDLETPIPSGQFGAPSDPRTANQIKAVSDKLNTGLKTIEVSGVSLGGGDAMDLIDKIPKQQFKEINRLKQLTGVDLTFHGPLVEPTGVGRDRWDEHHRAEAERQMLSAVERGHELDPQGNVVITFHSSNGFPEPETYVKDEHGNKKLARIAVINERNGQMGPLPLEGKDYLLETSDEPDKQLEKFNTNRWKGEISNLSTENQRGAQAIQSISGDEEKLKEIPVEERKAMYELFDTYKDDPNKAKEQLKTFTPEMQKYFNIQLNNLNYGYNLTTDAWQKFQEQFNNAYDSAERTNNKEDKKRLDEYRKRIQEDYKKVDFVTSPKEIEQLSQKLNEGINLLSSITAPQLFRPLKEFGYEKASETFGNVAYKAFKQFKEHTPIISIENPPAGMGMSSGEDLKKIVEMSRKQFIEKAKTDGMSEEKAKEEAEKLIGVTWDVGHINMIRKQGFTEKDVIEESRKVADVVKHVHLSINFGLAHPELPMGMGNVPTKKILDLKKGFEKAKKIIETGGWFQDFKTTPFRETLTAFNSPVYGMKMGPYWGSTAGRSGSYFSGYGRVLPDQHFNMYGAGFSQLPVELGGQMSGTNRLSGSPAE